ncbi:hypothetical protein NPIL_395451 [Nephila pilipes]|uniref:Uncharacterized protein n=1 Tax=Nephila pilipes TaxID=299642 RepID=A0A8X6IS63_NEPPI|nr:hypothetical protein NPIL_395451 [Nephila pilipes]
MEKFCVSYKDAIREMIRLRDAYALWACKLSVALCKNEAEFHHAHAKLGKGLVSLTIGKSHLNVPIFKFPVSEAFLDRMIAKKKQHTKRKNLQNIKPPSDNKGISTSSKMAKQVPKKNLKRTLDAEEYQLPPKHRTIKECKAPLPTLPSALVQTITKFLFTLR